MGCCSRQNNSTMRRIIFRDLDVVRIQTSSAHTNSVGKIKLAGASFWGFFGPIFRQILLQCFLIIVRGTGRQILETSVSVIDLTMLESDESDRESVQLDGRLQSATRGKRTQAMRERCDESCAGAKRLKLGGGKGIWEVVGGY